LCSGTALNITVFAYQAYYRSKADRKIGLFGQFGALYLEILSLVGTVVDIVVKFQMRNTITTYLTYLIQPLNQTKPTMKSSLLTLFTIRQQNKRVLNNLKVPEELEQWGNT
jgi:hypothetical protein